MLAFERVMVATDFSRISESAVQHAVELANWSKAELVGCHVLEPSAMLAALAATEPTPGIDVQASNAREEMEQLLRDAGAGDFRVLIEKGHAGKEIVRIGENEDIDLIVVGTHGRTGLAHVLLGSTAEYVVRHAKCTVMVVRQ